MAIINVLTIMQTIFLTFLLTVLKPAALVAKKFDIMYHHYMTIDNIYNKEKKIKPYIYLIIYSIYTAGWGYILVNIFFI